MKISNSLNQWLSEKGMDIYMLLSITFVPQRTFENIIKEGRRLIPALYRLYLVTDLAEFSLSIPEKEKYEESKAEEGKTKLDELIATALWKEWLSKGGLHMDDRLSTGNKQGKPKAVLTEALVKKYYGKNSPSTTNHQSNGNGMNGTSAPTGILLIAGQEIKQAIMGDDASFERYMKVNGKEIKQLSNLLSVFTQPDRKDALKKFSETLFPHA
jgi:hypothetical protein